MRWIVSCVCVSMLVAVAGCGDSGDSAADALATQMKINRIKRQAKEDAKQEMAIANLKKKVRNQSNGSNNSGGTVAVTPTAAPASTSTSSGSSDYQSFHTPGVSCELDSSHAKCTVNSTGEDFVLNAGSTAYRDYSASLPSGNGSSAGWGTSYSAGSVTCSVPQSYEAAGITCSDGSGHGFEASKVEDRKSAY